MGKKKRKKNISRAKKEKKRTYQELETHLRLEPLLLLLLLLLLPPLPPLLLLLLLIRCINVVVWTFIIIVVVLNTIKFQIKNQKKEKKHTQQGLKTCCVLSPCHPCYPLPCPALVVVCSLLPSLFMHTQSNHKKICQQSIKKKGR